MLLLKKISEIAVACSENFGRFFEAQNCNNSDKTQILYSSLKRLIKLIFNTFLINKLQKLSASVLHCKMDLRPPGA